MAEFQPRLDERTVRTLIDSYKKNPDAYANLKDTIQQHADYHNIPFYSGEFSISDALTDLGSGFIEGFTTLKVGDTPDNEYEAIFKNLGHLAGFAPGIIGAPLGAAAKVSAKLGLKTTSLMTAANTARSLNNKSVPMAVANFATKQTKKIVKPFLNQGRLAKNDAVRTASNFILGERARHIAEGAFHLGAASAASAWQGGVDEMMAAFVGGAQAGGVFRSIGNFVNTGSEAGNKVAKTLAGSLFMGLPATMRGATTPEQVYEYVMGAWFGGQERPWTVAKAQKFSQKYEKDAQKPGNEALVEIYDPARHPEFSKLPPEVQKEVVTQFNQTRGTVEEQVERTAANELQKQLNIETEKLLEQEGVPKVEVKTEPTKIVEKEKEVFETGSTEESNVGVEPTIDPKIGNKAQNIVRFDMPDFFKGKEITSQERLDQTAEITTKMSNILDKYVRGPKTNESSDAFRKIQEMLQEDYKYQIKNSNKDPERVLRTEGDIRQFITRYKNDKVTEVLTTDGTNIYFLTEQNAKNLAGNKKILTEPLKIADQIWKKLTGKDERAHTFLDHIVVEGENGQREISLQKLKQMEYAEYGGAKDYYNLVGGTIKEMNKKGYSYFGGKGTADRLYFMKHHPKSNTAGNMRTIISQFKASDIRALRNDFKKKYNLTQAEFDRGFASNVLWQLEMNGLEFTPANIKKMQSDGFLKNAIAFNKRLPLLMTDAYSAEKEFFTNKQSPGHIADLVEGNFRYNIIPDFGQNLPKRLQDKIKEAAKFSDIESTKTEEHLDGAIIARDDVVRALNLEKGTPESGTNKSLIVSPNAEHGALLGKYAIHPAGPKLSAEMKDAGIHMNIMASAVKQKGTREFYEVYDLDPTHIKQDLGIKQSKKFIAPQSIKKQMLTNLVEAMAFQKASKDGFTVKEAVDGIFKDFMEPRIKGDAKANEALDAYLEKLPTASDKQLAKELDKLDFDAIGLERITDAMKQPGNQLFSKAFYNYLLLNRKSAIREEYAEGVMTEAEYDANNREVEYYHSVAQKMIAAARKDAIKRGKPENEANIFTHPDINKYRDKMMSSWIVNSVTKPKVKNSAAAIIRPYDEGLQKDLDGVNPRLKELNTNSKIFFLGDKHKKKVIETELYGKKTLEELYSTYLSKSTPESAKKRLEEVFRTAVIRVPADSNSGTQILQFAGFTGRNDYGILMHGLKMRALGGADLDIDSAYMYFGGKGGLKKEYKDVMEAQEQEFYVKQKDGRFKIADNKAKEFEKKLIQEYSPREDALFKSQAGMFAPNMRHQASEGAVEGRGLLGGAAVNPKNIMASAYQMILNKGKDEFTVKHFGKDIKVTLIPKTKPQEIDYANKLMRAMVGFSSDAMDYGKPKGYENWYKQALEAHFIVKSKVPLAKLNVSEFNKNGVIGMLSKANNAYYGKDYTNQRQYTMEDRKNLTAELMAEDPKNITTMTPKIARLLHNIDYSDHALNRVKFDRITDLYNNYNKSVAEYSSLKGMLGRRTLKTPTPTIINKVYKYNLLNPDALVAAAKNKATFYDVIKGTKFATFKKAKNKLYTEQERIAVLERLKEQAGDFSGRDIQTMVTVQELVKIIDVVKKRVPGITKAEVNAMIEDAHTTVEKLKAESYLMRDDRNSLDTELNIGRQRKSKGSSIKDQNAIDAEIRKWKRNRTDIEKRLFDTLMLGSLNRGNLEKLAELNAIKLERPLTNKEQKDYDTELTNTARTSSSMLGYNSEAMETNSIGKFLGEINNTYNEVSTHRAPEQIRREGTILLEEPTKKESIEKGWPEESDAKLTEVFTTGWEGVKEAKGKTKLDAETKGYIDDIVMDLKTENNKVVQNIGFIAREVVGKDINIFNKQDWMVLRNWLRDTKTGTFWQRLKGEDISKVSQRTYLQFPETINKELMRDEIVLMQKKGIFMTAEGMKTGKSILPTQYIDITQYRIKSVLDAADAANEQLSLERVKEYTFLDAIPEGKQLWEVAMVKRELPMAEKILTDVSKKDKPLAMFHAKTYTDAFNEITKKHKYETDLKDKVYTVEIDKKLQKLKGSEIVDIINNKETAYYKKELEIAQGNVPKDSSGNLKVIGTTADGQPLYALQKAIEFGIPGFTSGPKNSGYVKGFYDPKTKQNPIINFEKLVNDFNRAVAKNKKIPTEFGIDGINTIARSMKYEIATNTKKLKKKELKKMYETFPSRTGRISEEMYFPHNHFSKKTALNALKEYVKYIRKSSLDAKEQDKLITKLTYRHHALTGDYMFEAINTWEGFNKSLENIGKRKQKKEERISWLQDIKKTGSQLSREGHIPGYSLDIQVPTGYGKSLNNTYYKQWAQILARDTISKFEQSMFDRKVPENIKESWSTFLKLYVQGAIGNPDVVPEYVYENPNMKIKGTPYGWWADNRVKDRLNKIGDKLGLIKKELPEELRGLDLNDVRNWSNLEAKFELASLLAHPKSVVANIFGGTMHTVQSVGMKTWMDARNNKYMAALSDKFASKEAREAFVIKQGVLPEQLLEEYGLATEYQSSRNKEFIELVARKLKRDPNLSSESVLDLGKEKGITRPVTELAAKFMSVPERALRRDAFMAHYLFWYKKFNGAIREFDHPILIDLAKKGVKSTQFLYSAPFRPMFARTALGKVMTRFQLWGWNAIRFRREALRQARLYGFKGKEAERVARIMQLDLFVFSLGNAFAYSLFDTAMPSPWNWMQDTSEWLFGDEKDKKRAFFGQWPQPIAPLQLITPPIARLPMASMRAVLEDDWERVANYYIHTMYPFGRISRDFVAQNNLIENPMSLVDKWTGIPLIGLSRASKELREGEERKVPTPGSGLTF